MSEDPSHDATTIRASKGGGNGGKWLLGALGAVVLLGGGYYAWKSMGPSDRTNIDAAYNDTYEDDPLRAGPIEPDQNVPAESASTDESAAPPASAERRSAPARRSTARAEAVPEETIGITPASMTTASTMEDSEEVIVRGIARPIWANVPSERRLSQLYPERALNRGREGEASLHCTVLDGGALDCSRVSETSSQFGTAALRVSRTLRHASQLADGSTAAGTPVNLRVVFRMKDEQRG